MSVSIGIEVDRINDLQSFDCETATEITIDSGVVSALGMYHTIDTEADASSDTLTTINIATGLLMIRQENAAREVIIANGTGAGNITTPTGGPLTMPDYGGLLLYRKLTTEPWYVFGDFSSAAAGGGINNVVEDTTPQLGGQLDVNGNSIGDGTNELITFTEDASAVNHVNIENEAAGSGPIISAAGDDANIDLNLQGKATGNVVIRDGTDPTKTLSVELSGATTAKTLTLTSSHTDDRTLTLPDADVDLANTPTAGEKTVLGNTSGTNTGDEAAASTTVSGVVELATVAETDTGTDTVRAVTPDGLAGSVYGTKIIEIQMFESDAAVATGDAKIGITIPTELAGYDVVNAAVGVYDKGVTGTTDVMWHRKRGATTVDILSTAITVGDEYYAEDGVINTSNDDLAAGDYLFPGVDAIHSGTAPNGLTAVIMLRLP